MCVPVATVFGLCRERRDVGFLLKLERLSPRDSIAQGNERLAPRGLVSPTNELRVEVPGDASLADPAKIPVF